MALYLLSALFIRIRCTVFYAFLFVNIIQAVLSQIANDGLSSSSGLPTVTVRGFLNFKTTVDGTVIVFTPASDLRLPSTNLKPTKALTETFRPTEIPTDDFLQKGQLNPQEGIQEVAQDINYASPPQNSLDAIQTRAPSLSILDNKINDPFLPHISENAVLPSTEQHGNDLDKMKKIQSSNNPYPTGLVTVLGGTFVEGPSTTVFETKVIGTFIDGKYAQILQSTSRIVSQPPSYLTASPVMSYTTLERNQNKESHMFTSSVSKIPPLSLKTIKTTENVEVMHNTPIVVPPVQATATVLPIEVSETISFEEKHLKFRSDAANTIHAPANIKEKSLSSSMTIKPNGLESSKPVLESSFLKTDSLTVQGLGKPTESLQSLTKSSTIKVKSPLASMVSTITRFPDEDNNVASAQKTLRNNTSRTRFTSPRRPSQTVRLNRFKVKLTLRHDSSDEYNVTLPTDDEDMEEDHTHKADEDIDIGTESFGLIVDPAKVVFQETTITSEVTLHVGRRKSIRTLTITTSVPLTVHPSDIHHILSPESTDMEDDMTDFDPFHHTVTRTYTTTERALKTSIVPVFDGKSTTYHTVTESFFIMKIITAFRTLPSGDASILESVLDETEVVPTTLEVAANIQPSVIQSAPPDQFPVEETIQPSIAGPITVKAHPQLTNPILNLGHALSNNPFAAVYLGLQQLNAQMTLYSTITDVSTYVTTQTIYSTKTIRFYDGRSTRYRTVSDPISTKKSTVTTTITAVQPYLNTQALQQQQQLQRLIGATQLAPPQPQFSTVTSSYTTITTATSLSTRIYTLIYNGFSTKFRTVTSTTLYPTTVVVTSTKTVPLTPTQVNMPFAYPYAT